MSLDGTFILVADDQGDVARILTEPLRRAGASLRYVNDGEAALDKISQGGYDLVIVDMKMPPNDWGGLWLLEQLEQQDIKVPCVVLSGESQQRQTAAALRLGAKDWISKEEANTELVDRCAALLQAEWGHAVETVAASGPGPLAFAFARYQRAVGGELQYFEAIRLLEETVKFVTLIGLSTSSPEHCGPLRGVRVDAFTKPSFGTWVTALRSLVSASDVNPLFAVLAQQLMANGDKQIQKMQQLRNDLAHAGAGPNSADRHMVLRLVDAWAHRLSLVPFIIGDDARTQYVDPTMVVTLREYRGAFPPRKTQLTLAEPEHLGPDPFLFVEDRRPVGLAPWFCTLNSDENEESTIGFFDGVKSANPKRPQPADPLTYTDASTGERGRLRLGRTATWGDIAPWFRTDT